MFVGLTVLDSLNKIKPDACSYKRKRKKKSLLIVRPYSSLRIMKNLPVTTYSRTLASQSVRYTPHTSTVQNRIYHKPSRCLSKVNTKQNVFSCGGWSVKSCNSQMGPRLERHIQRIQGTTNFIWRPEASSVCFSTVAVYILLP